MSKYTYNEKFFTDINNEEKAYWLGFLYADGCITRFYKNERLKSMSLELTLQEEDKGHLFKFLQSLESNVPIQNKTVKGKDKKYNANRLVVNCTNICRDLIDKGCTPQKSLTLEFPSWLNENLVRHFIRGYFDGNGCVYFNIIPYYYKQKNNTYNQKKFNVSFVGTYDFLNSIKNILIKLNIKCTEIYSGNTGRAFEFRLYGHENIKKFYDYLYNDNHFCLKRKYEKFQYAFSNI
jgi:hypothetical protein